MSVRTYENSVYFEVLKLEYGGFWVVLVAGMKSDLHICICNASSLLSLFQDVASEGATYTVWLLEHSLHSIKKADDGTSTDLELDTHVKPHN